MSASVLALVDDMIFESKIAATAGALGVALAILRDPQKAAARLAETGAATFVVDLGTMGDPVAAIRAAKALPSPPRVVAYLSHVEVELAESAREAGADEVLPRSRFVQRLPEILSGR